ncbi:alanine racemase [Paractinoplanes brasiliensis]|uniref:D-serine deaminase-like pyridoxal phosphate-dependent protein n=1 Tax=Paractinoplanes brasiliensis TaxID=52695 RepID=A0A4R6K314_9ACTN|nr:alanine racemase [Actinoplanes brasiliensis]TDO41585.1 D-serine deaminase-like pyridoxal phosphate-dependent protein [Actinoplanes brasiliensis]GID27128.1 amino acid deaminase [Actinoplanes brasiliensis]
MDVPEVIVDWRSKGFWIPEGSISAAGISADLFGGLFTWPLLVLRRDAAEANIATMAAYCRRHGWEFAPHAKTTMAPGLLARQMAAGAWGLTVATANQALVLRRLGVPRVLIANQVLDPTTLRWLAGETAAGWEVYFQVDSAEGARAAAGAGSLRVLVELGHENGRTGIRSPAGVEEVARVVAEAPGLELAGLTAYEGQLKDQREVDDFLDRVMAAFERLRAAGLLPERPILSAGGSAWFDRVVERVKAVDATLVLRSGASVTHDDGFYRERTPFLRVPQEGPLAAALDIWAQVISAPEPGLALAGMGKRDAPFDEGLPAPMEIRRADGTYAATTGIEVTKLNDHHTYLSTGDTTLTPGDLVRFGISHPCTAFDKWRHIPVVDADRRVVDVLATYF